MKVKMLAVVICSGFLNLSLAHALPSYQLIDDTSVNSQNMPSTDGNSNNGNANQNNNSTDNASSSDSSNANDDMSVDTTTGDDDY